MVTIGLTFQENACEVPNIVPQHAVSAPKS